MNVKKWKTAVVGVAGAALAAATLVNAGAAEPAQRTHRMLAQSTTHTPAAHSSSSHTSTTHSSMRSAPKKETVTLEIRGANSAEGARLLSGALTAHQVNAAIQPSQGKPYRVTTAIDPRTDLGAIGQAVMTTSTPDKFKAPPSLDLVMFGKFDQASAKKVAAALAKIKGIDARDSTANPTTGELNIRLNGGSKVTVDQIHRALQDAGVGTQLTRNSATRSS